MLKVTVYSTPNCPFCIKTKDFLKKHEVTFDDVDVSTNQEKMDYIFEKTGQPGVPVIEIGDTFIVGYNEGALKQALKLS